MICGADLQFAQVHQHPEILTGLDIDEPVTFVEAPGIRVDLVDTLDRVAGSPGADRISAWLGSLSDADVLERMSRMKTTHTYDPAIVRRNFEVLESLCAEATAFKLNEATDQ